MSKKVIVIGSGFAGISVAANLAKSGFSVTVLEKNEQPGGRARSFESNGFLFDMGPSWYWMPEVFENFYQSFKKKASDYYNLIRLDPSYRVYFGEKDFLDIPAKMEELENLFEQLEPGSSKNLKKFISESAYKYEVGMRDLVHKPAKSILEFADLRLLKGMLKMHVFQSISNYIKKYFSHPRLIQLLEFPVLFLGATPWKTPALYSLMNYADMALGTWYPMGGMHNIVKAMKDIAEEQGVVFKTGINVEAIKSEGRNVKGVFAGDHFYEADIVVGGADYHHIDQHLLAPNVRMYSDDYWQKRVMAPSSLIFYLGVNKKIEGLQHHNLFFDQDFVEHAKEIYESPKWPENPLFYVCCPSKTDPSVAPEGKENLFILVPVAPDLEDNEEIREHYYNMVIGRLEKIIGQKIKEDIIYKRSFAHKDFISDYNAFKGNAYGLANTLRQTAILKPALKNKKLNNLFYTGQLTVPGPGVPPSIISGQVVAKEINKAFKA
ncbi:phytoene desaturase [Hyphobacterium sp. CCMP332]|nr:phytoene desaturase [Hyphobacterium sp. CCMP332]